jgi:SpoVK/Ycf46/Vps4 family AAA+-type ATPase
MTQGGLSVVIATILTTYIIQFFDISQALYGPIYTGLDQAFQNMTLDYESILSHLTFKNILGLIGLYFAYKYYSTVESYIKYYITRDKKYNVLNLYDNNEIRTFLEYVDYFKNFFEVPKQMEYGNPELKVQAKEYTKNIDIEDMAYFKKSVDGIKVTFNDTNFNYKGYYMWKRKEIKITKKEESYTIFTPYIHLCIEDRKGADVNEYYNQITKKCEDMSNDEIEILHVKMMKDEGEIINNEFVVYDGKKKPLEELENLYIAPFFHKERDRLWKILKEINFNPQQFYKFGQAPRMGLLLHGPPGTGKSTFAFRIAMALNRHIVSMDLRSIKNKHEIYRALRSPYIDGLKCEPKEIVYIFDEFDLTVRELHAKKSKMSGIYETWMKHISKINHSFEEPTITSNDKKKKGNKAKSKFIDLLNAPKTHKNLDESDDEELDKDETSSDKKKKDYSMESFGYDTEDLSLEDLLEILQGPVPLEGSIIIATTNKYEDIKELCPALFRPGRLTPVHFDYADNWLVNEICKYFYKQEYNSDEDVRKYDISPSYLIQIASESNFYDGDKYQYFIERLNKTIEEAKEKGANKEKEKKTKIVEINEKQNDEKNADKKVDENIQQEIQEEGSDSEVISLSDIAEKIENDNTEKDKIEIVKKTDEKKKKPKRRRTAIKRVKKAK